MLTFISRSRPWWLGGVACGGVVLSHWIAYLAVPEGTLDHALAQTGHRYWGHFVALALAASVAALTSFSLRALRGEDRRCRRSLERQFLSLVALQGGGLFLLEATERALSGHFDGVAGLATEPAVAWGLLVQVAVAAAAVGGWFASGTSSSASNESSTGPAPKGSLSHVGSCLGKWDVVAVRRSGLEGLEARRCVSRSRSDFRNRPATAGTVPRT